MAFEACVRAIAVAAAAATLASSCGSTPSVAVPNWTGPKPNTNPMSASDTARIDTAGEQIIATMGTDLPGVWIGVWDAERGYHVGAYGKAALPETAATVDDHNRIGSVSKTFTTATVLRLIDQGKLRMESTVRQVLPDLATHHPGLAAITVTQLVNMTSGIPDYANTGAIFSTLVNEPTNVWTPDEIIDLSQTMPNAEPGTPGYTSTATIILGEMIAAVSGQPVEQAVDQTAHDAALPPPSDATMPAPASHGYVFAPGAASLKEAGATIEPGTDVSDWSPSWGGAAGGMYSTVSDLGAWAGTGFGATLLSQELGTARLGGPTTTGEGGDAYGLGLIHWGPDWVGHTGQIVGWESFAAYNVKTGDVIVMMINETGSLPKALPKLLDVANPELRHTLDAGR